MAKKKLTEQQNIWILPNGTPSRDFLEYMRSLDADSVGRVGSNDIEITDSSKGLILRSPNGTRWRLGVSNAGVLTATVV